MLFERRLFVQVLPVLVNNDGRIPSFHQIEENILHKAGTQNKFIRFLQIVTEEYFLNSCWYVQLHSKLQSERSLIHFLKICH